MSLLERLRQRLNESASALEALETLPGSEWNSLLLHLFRSRSQRISVAHLKDQFRRNRFVGLAALDPLSYKELELKWLRMASQQDFEPVILSPVTPLGTCSGVAKVDQHNVISAVRGTEVVSDATNVLAFQVAAMHEGGKHKSRVIKYATTHRHLRGQAYDNPAFTAHFGIFCLVSGGYDRGNMSFEMEQLFEHMDLYYQLLSENFEAERLSVRLFLKDADSPIVARLHQHLENHAFSYPIDWVYEQEPGDYYYPIQFKMYLDNKMDLADGGLVDWTQTLLSNRKHRLFISGAGIELVHKFREGGTS